MDASILTALDRLSLLDTSAVKSSAKHRINEDNDDGQRTTCWRLRLWQQSGRKVEQA